VPVKLFADQCISNYIVQKLRDSGMQVEKLRDHIPCNSPDEVVIKKAQELDAVLISLNGDFSDIINYPPEQYKGIISLQVRNHPEIIPQMVELLISFLEKHNTKDYYLGKLLLVEMHRIRIR